MATQEQLTNLKAQWKGDPCWDIEDTEGFKEHRAELAAFREAQEAAWTKQRQDDLNAKAEQLGVPGNHVLAQYVIGLEQRLNDLELRHERSVERLAARITKLGG